MTNCILTFIDVLTGETTVSLAVAQVTDTLVGPHHVLTGPVTAHSAAKEKNIM